VTWQAHLQHTDTGLAIVFAGPVSRLDLAPDVAAHLASLLAIEARHRLAGVVLSLETDRPSRHSVPFSAENDPVAPLDGHPLCCDCDDCLNGDHQ
jgi:hypothetical protein